MKKRKVIGKTHFYCGFCDKLFSKEDLDAVTGRHTKYEMEMIKLGNELMVGIDLKPTTG